MLFSSLLFNKLFPTLQAVYYVLGLLPFRLPAFPSHKTRHTPSVNFALYPHAPLRTSRQAALARS